MRTITIHIEDSIWDTLREEAALILFSQGCVSIDKLELAMCGIIKAIDEGKAEVTIAKPKEKTDD